MRTSYVSLHFTLQTSNYFVLTRRPLSVQAFSQADSSLKELYQMYTRFITRN